MTDIERLERRVAALEELMDRIAESFRRIEQGMEVVLPLLLEQQASIAQKH